MTNTMKVRMFKLHRAGTIGCTHEALVLATALVVLILYGREFRSEVLQVLRD
jgi:uncharacterized membrane protein